MCNSSWIENALCETKLRPEKRTKAEILQIRSIELTGATGYPTSIRSFLQDSVLHASVGYSRGINSFTLLIVMVTAGAVPPAGCRNTAPNSRHSVYPQTD